MRISVLLDFDLVEINNYSIFMFLFQAPGSMPNTHRVLSKHVLNRVHTPFGGSMERESKRPGNYIKHIILP